jgi:hypothetical protein
MKLGHREFPDLNKLKEVRGFDENPRDPEWSQHDRHFFIITDASRPVYCRHGNEINVTPLLCTIVAFTGQLSRDGGQVLKTVVAGDRLFVFYCPFPFIFAAVSSARVPASILMRELKVLEMEIFSLLTPGVTQILLKRPNFDIKGQTGSSERLFTSVLDLMDHAHWFIFENCAPRAAITEHREQFAGVIHRNRIKSAFAVVVFHYGDVVLTVEDSAFHVTPDDILVLANDTYPVVSSSTSRLTPIWLPSHTDMLHVLTMAVPGFELFLVIISGQGDAYQSLTNMGQSIIDEWKREEMQTLIQPLDTLPSLKILHWMIADHNLQQCYSPYMMRRQDGEKGEEDIRDVIYRNYAWVYEELKNPAMGIRGEFCVTSHELTVFGTHGPAETLIAAAPVGTRPAQVAELLTALQSFAKERRKMIFEPTPLKWK